MQTKSWGERREEEGKEEEEEEYGKEAEGGSGWRGMKNRWTNKGEGACKKEAKGGEKLSI